MTIQKATQQDAPTLAGLARMLWDGHTIEDLSVEFRDLLQSQEAACFLAYEEDAPVGFAQCQLRHDYVEGTQTSPVGYLEGIYVAEAYRKQGFAKALLAACESWAKSKGCCEFASDCELDNTQSLQFHLCVGFEEANRIICFIKNSNFAPHFRRKSAH